MLPFEKELSFYGLHQPTPDEQASVANITGDLPTIFREELDFDFDQMTIEAKKFVDKFNSEQLTIFQRIMQEVKLGKGKCFFLKARGGCGKTFLLTGLLKSVRCMEQPGCVALATATTGKAAMHLPGGRTFHSRFKAPLNPAENDTLNIKLQSDLAQLIRAAKVIVIDEVTMMDNFLLKAMEESLRDIMQTQVVFGGKVSDFSFLFQVIH